MDDPIRTWLYDILQSITENEGYYEDWPRIFEDFQNDVKTKRAIERNLEIIGEAVNRILKQDSSFYLKHSKQIIGTRNRIIHSYDSVSDEMIWSIVNNHLPRLRKEIEKQLI